MRRAFAIFVAFGAVASMLQADGPGDNLAEKVRAIPPAGIAVPQDVRRELRQGADELLSGIESLKKGEALKPGMAELIPDVEIFAKALDWALRYNEFFDAKEFPQARKLLEAGKRRLEELREGRPSWPSATGLVVRGYRSRIDDSVQPYGLVIPANYDAKRKTPWRLDLWWHGRGEKLSELSFLNDRSNNPGQFTPPDAIVLHPYGRYCNANKFAGEFDTFEAIEHVKKQYRIDDSRIVARGFSMGGAACWQFATHYPGFWVAAAPGAGFSETPEFLRVFQNESLKPTAWEQKLWRWYDATDYAANLLNVPTVAYSGEEDRQKQAADAMEKALKAEKMDLVHLIGPKTKHAYHPETKKEINQRIDAIVSKGKPRLPEKVRFTTWTLRYPENNWVRIEGMGEHWERARVEGEIIGINNRAGATDIRLTTSNVTALSLNFPTNSGIFGGREGRVTIDGQELMSKLEDGQRLRMVKGGEGWKVVQGSLPETLAKVPGLQGPIDDAFCGRFVFVPPSGPPEHEAVGAWVKSEFDRAVAQWRQVYRGDAIVRPADQVSASDLETSHLVLWGDPKSNPLIAKVMEKLPIQWSAANLQVGVEKFPAGHHVPILVYPNPLNPKKYVVLNSGFTFREYDALNNARQTPKLPDWAVIDVRTPPSTRWPGKVVAADFFDEKWAIKPTAR